jgi:hypothetical protein
MPRNSPVTELLHAALSYAQNGYAVHPLKPGGKAPLLPHGLKEASTDLDQVRAWWEKWPDANIGIVPPEGIVVVDVDPRNGGTLEALPGALSGGMTARTGGGGWHLWYKAPEGVEKLTSLLPGVDLKTHRGYVVAPPSVTDAPYRWLSEGGPRKFPHDWLEHFVKVAPEPEAKRTSLEDGYEGASIADAYTAKANWYELLSEHGWQLVSGDGAEGSRWRHPEATAEFSATITNDCLFVYSPNTPFEATEAGAPRGYTKFAAYAVLEHGGDMSAAARALRPPREDRARSELLSAADDPFDDEPESALERMRLIDWPTAWQEDISAEDWLIKPVLTSGRGHALFAKGGGAKSWLTLQLVAALATGRAVLNRPAGEPVDVLYLDYEMTWADLKDRLDIFGYDDESDLSHLHYALFPEIPELDTREGGALVREVARRVGAKLVVIDTTARAIVGEENSADTYKAFYRFTGAPLKRDGVAWLRIDHAGKDLAKGQRGSSSKNDDVDVVWQLERRDGNALRLEATKRRMPWVPAIVELTEVETDLGPVYTVPPEPTLPDKTYDVVRLLDRLRVPLTAGRPKVRAIVKEHGIKARNDAISAALRIRRETAEMSNECSETLSPNSGTARKRPPVPKSGTVTGTGVKGQVEARDSSGDSDTLATCPDRNPNEVGYGEGAGPEESKEDLLEGFL